jgi:hypothetical protein
MQMAGKIQAARKAPANERIQKMDRIQMAERMQAARKAQANERIQKMDRMEAI